jgi:hypothetical protein
MRSGKDRLLTEGLTPEESAPDESKDALEQASKATNSNERDIFYAQAARTAAHKGDIHARDHVEKIEDTELRKQVRSYVDMSLLGRALDKKDVEGATQLLRTGELSHINRVWGLTSLANLIKTKDRGAALEFLEEASAEAKRIDASDPDRVRALMSVATLMIDLDRGRIWELMSEVTKAANASSDYTGEDGQVTSSMRFGQNASMTSSSAEGFDVAGIFTSLTKEDMQRAVELARAFTGDAPRSNAILAIVREVLNRKPS